MKQRIVLILAVAVAPATAHAQPNSGATPQRRGTVLQIDGHDIYIDRGRDHGLTEGSRLTLYHVIEAEKPGGAVLRDSFPIGPLTVRVVGNTLAVTEADQSLRQRIAVGDEVELESAPVTYVDPWRDRARSNRPSSASQVQDSLRAAEARVASDERAVGSWRQRSGLTLDEQIAIWQRFIDADPDSPHSSSAAAEIQSLARLSEQLAARDGQSDTDHAAWRAAHRLLELDVQARASNGALEQAATLPLDSGGRPTLVLHPPSSSLSGKPIAIAALMATPSRVEQAWLYARSSGADRYQRVIMRADGDGYLRAEIPAELVGPPVVEYFIEVLDAGSDEPTDTFGSAQMPLTVRVERPIDIQPPPRIGRSRVSMFLDYVDFDGLGSDYDQYVHGEIDFMYRFYSPIYSLRLGFGTMNGVGGPKDVIDEDPSGECMAAGRIQCHRVGYNYGFAEVELRFSDLLAFMVRPQWGSAYEDPNPASDADREFFDAMGLRGRLRIGDELRSNLVLGAGATRRLGRLFEGAFTWDVIPRFPIVLSVQVTDQPVLEDYGVRLIADVGWRGLRWMYPSLRMAYQARDIDHAGASLGAAINFDW